MCFPNILVKKTNEYLNSTEQIPRNWNVDQLSMSFRPSQPQSAPYHCCLYNACTNTGGWMKGSHPRPADRCPFVLRHSISQVTSFMQLGMLWKASPLGKSNQMWSGLLFIGCYIFFGIVRYMLRSVVIPVKMIWPPVIEFLFLVLESFSWYSVFSANVFVFSSNQVKSGFNAIWYISDICHWFRAGGCAITDALLLMQWLLYLETNFG